MTALYQEAGLLSREEALQLRNQQFTFDNGVTSTPLAMVEWYQMDRIIRSLAPGYINPIDQRKADFDESYR
jgi:hypothetical protein